MPLEQIVQEWLEMAGHDMAAARFIMGMNPRPLEIIGFHCQQAIEKSLKAYIVLHDREPDKTHDLLILLKSCIEFDDDFSRIRESCANLTDYAVKNRYPYHAKIDEAKLTKDLEDTESAVSFIRRKIQKTQQAS